MNDKNQRFDKMEKGTSLALIILLIVSLLPVMYLGRYNHPTGDDYQYGVETKEVWEQTGNLPATFAEAARGVAQQYKIWQGTYSAMFLMYLPPNIFGEWAYHLVTSVILLLLAGGTFYLMKPIVCGLLNGSVSLWYILSSLLALLCVQTVPSQGETFFWYNGSMYYTGFYAITLFLFGVILRYLTEAKRRHVPIMVILAAFLAGGNYVSLLPSLLILLLLAAALIYKKSRCAVGVGITATVMAGGLFVSAMAPGNAVRQSGMWKIPAWKAVLKSLLQGLHYMKAWTGVWLILSFLIMTPFLWKAFSKTSFHFRYPLVAAGFIYGIFCSMSCPTFYTMNSTGPARTVAIVYYGFLLAVFVCYMYFLGWLHRVAGERQLSSRIESSLPVFKMIFFAICILLFSLQLFRGRIFEITTGKAIQTLANGEAAAYEQEYQERMFILEDDSVSDAVLKPYEHQPDMLYVGDFTGNAEDATNKKIAKYFGKNTLRVEY